MSPLRQHMITALQLSGKGEHTHQSYVREVRLLVQFYHKSPDRIPEPELQRYFLHRKNVDGLAPASMRICYSGIRFFYQHVLRRDWHILALIRPQTAHRLPAVLSVEEVRQLLTSATPLHNQVSFTNRRGLPTLRHAYATHLLEAGVHPRLIQRSLGPTQLATTMVYLHLTHQGHEDAYERLNALMHELLP